MTTFAGQFIGYLPIAKGTKLRKRSKRFRVQARDRMQAMDRIARTIPSYRKMVFRTFIFGGRSK